MMEGSLEIRDSAHWQWCHLATLWTWETGSPTYQTLQALLTIDVKTLEQLWLFVGVQTYPTGHLLLDLLESFLDSSGGFGSHGSVSSAADKLERGSGQDWGKKAAVQEDKKLKTGRMSGLAVNSS